MFVEHLQMLLRRPTRFEACAIGQRTPKHQAAANRTRSTGGVDATFRVF